MHILSALEPANKKHILRILAALLLFIAAMLAQSCVPLSHALYLLSYAAVGYDVLYKAGRNILRGQVFDESFLMALATLGALALGDMREAVFVMLFFQLGEFFQNIAVARSRKSIQALAEIRPDTAHIEKDGALIAVQAEDVQPGTCICVRPGERIALDGCIVEGESTLDTSALTGESLPRAVKVGDTVLSGCINCTGVLRIRTTRGYEESTASRILELVEEAAEKKARSEQFISRFARVYTPSVVIAALLLAFVPVAFGGELAMWVHRALLFLVISCPCALVISVPLGFFGGIGGASRKGILIKGGNDLETLASVKTIVFDKTGTLTQGAFRVEDVRTENGVSAQTILSHGAAAEAFSTHPIARAICAAGSAGSSLSAQNVQEKAGHGVCAEVEGTRVLCGTEELLAKNGIALPTHISDVTGACVHVAIGDCYAGCILLADQPKPGAAAMMHKLRRQGISKTVLLTGDTESAASALQSLLSIDECHARLLPGDKVTRMESILAASLPKEKVAYVGDGINDAPVLTRADVGIAMGALGSDAAIEAADVVFMNDDPASLCTAIGIARKTMRIIRENIWFALASKGIVLILGALGIAPMWLAVFADVGVALVTICNSMRALRW